ncbi:response regulator [Pseudomonas indica]|uniref:Response regulator receiver domain-containing protein n=1 Tax=Pseudomonas indica TaxID=137658 RepID=A0A1G8XR53_9PSED|nr:response regulator [Pseudomonas indica]MBU3054813.1 response regulator [Pseudomonas indica]PAU53817.1 two-component system response regulator [Pseudomonas indica]SDJ92957.1 Response regulator receiver domain-containing protein [Pseudomonas indica]
MDKNSIHILIADDDPDDCLLTREAFRESRMTNEVHFVHNGEELMDYLRHRPPYEDRQRHPRPGLILLDLNMPLKDGREALSEIKADENLRSIPVVVLTTSSAEEDIIRSYDCGVNSFITKPVSFRGLLDVVQTLGRYWLQIVELPEEHMKP